MIDRNVDACQPELKPTEKGREAEDKQKSAVDSTDFSTQGQKKATNDIQWKHPLNINDDFLLAREERFG